jgi:hypothetical protein
MLSGFTLTDGTTTHTVTRLDGSLAFQGGAFTGLSSSSFLFEAFIHIWGNSDDDFTALQTVAGMHLSRGGTCPV